MSDEEELYSRFYERYNIEYAQFRYILENTNTDYSNKPIPVLMQPSIIQTMIDKIEKYNHDNGTDYGFSFSSILSLVQSKKSTKTDPKYKSQLQLDTTNHGKEFLKKIFSMIISSDPMEDNTIMKMIEKTQSHFKSRKSDSNNPKLFLIYLPLGNDINILQQTIYEFLKKNKLWENYHYTYSNSKSNSDKDVKKYKEFVDKQMQDAKNEKDCTGCIIFLGNQGKMAYTYHECDVVIRLDNGTNIDDAEQVGYRCLTEGPITDNVDEKKTIGITVDLNIQRVYAVMRNKIKNYKKNNPESGKTYGQIIQYMYEENQFIFNPIEVEFGNRSTKIIEYYESYGKKLKSETLIETVICNIQCEDSLSDYIKKIKSKDGTYQANPKLNGKQPDCPKGGKTKKEADPIPVDESKSVKAVESDEDSDVDVDEPNIFNDINKTKNLYEFLTKISCLMLRIDHKNQNITNDVIELLKILKKDEKLFNIIKMKLKEDYGVSDTDINIIYDTYIKDMSNKNNIDILDDIFEIYSNTDPNVVRDIIGKHFIPSLEQKKKNAEVPTPPKLCDEMIDKIPSEFFMNLSNKTCEPCCGKGNFILAIFERYFNGLSHIEDECERCIYIIEKCLYFCEKESINVYITEELLKCHALSKMEDEFWNDWDNVLRICNVNFNSHVGNTLELNIQKKWEIEGFDAVIGNPPYEKEGASGDNKLYLEFTSKALSYWLKPNKYLLFITPPNTIDYLINYESKNRNYIDKFYNILYIAINTPNKYFNVGSKFCYFLLQNKEVEYTETEIKYLENKKEISFKYNLIKNKVYPVNHMNKTSIKIIDMIFSFKDEKFNIKNMTRGKWAKGYSENYFRIRTKQIKDKVVSSKKTTAYKYFIIDKLNKTYPNGQRYYIKNKLTDYDNEKVIFSKVGYVHPYYLKTGAISDNLLYMTVKNKLEFDSIKSITDSSIFKFISKCILFSGMDYWKVLIKLPKIDLDKIYTNDDLYKLFNLREEHIKLIENMV